MNNLAIVIPYYNYNDCRPIDPDKVLALYIVLNVFIIIWGIIYAIHIYNKRKIRWPQWYKEIFFDEFNLWSEWFILFIGVNGFALLIACTILLASFIKK